MVRVTLAWYHRSKTATVCWEQPHPFFEKILQSVYLSMSANMFGAWWAFAVASNLRPNKQTHPPWISDFLHCGTQHRRHDVTIKTCALIGCLRWWVLPNFRSRSCFFLNSHPCCDTCLIVKTLPFAECIVSHYTFRSQACSEQSKAHTSIAFAPRYFFAGTRNGTKVVTCFRQISAGLGNVFRLQKGAPKTCFAKKKCCKRVFFALIGKDIQKDFKKIYEIRSNH